MILLLAAHLLAGGGTAEAPVPGTPPPDAPAAQPECPRIMQPRWVRKPTTEERLRVYPRKALKEAISGRATIRCEVAADGLLFDCSVVKETPADAGFGAATLAITPKYRMSPKSAEGCPSVGTIVQISLDWFPDL